jgi:hypothetical protein
MAHTLDATAHSKNQSKKATASGWIGSALEYYDFFIYATAAALIFPQIFFPKGDPKTAIIASLATYGVGYVARPTRCSPATASASRKTSTCGSPCWATSWR